jgi:hypothetical protein
MVLVIVLTGIIAALGSKILASGFGAYVTGKDLIQTDWQGNMTLQRLSRDLRMVRSASVADLTMTPSSEITFTDNNGHIISYTSAGTTLMRNGVPLADDISSLSFSYITSDGKTTATSADLVYYIVVNFTASRRGLNQDISAVIHPRNFQ